MAQKDLENEKKKSQNIFRSFYFQIFLFNIIPTPPQYLILVFKDQISVFKELYLTKKCLKIHKVILKPSPTYEFRQMIFFSINIYIRLKKYMVLKIRTLAWFLNQICRFFKKKLKIQKKIFYNPRYWFIFNSFKQKQKI